MVLFHDVNGNGPDSLDVPADTAQFHLNETIRFIVSGRDTAVPCYLQVDTLGVCIQSDIFLLHWAPNCEMLGAVNLNCVDHSCRAATEMAHRHAELPLTTEISGAYPNPFNPETRIRFTLAAPEVVNMIIYNLAGQRVRTLASGNFAAGEHSVVWDGRTDANIPAGTGLYLCRMTASHSTSTIRLLLLR